MGKGRVPTTLEYYLINKQLKRYEERDRRKSINERRTKFNQEFNNWAAKSGDKK